MSSLNEEMVSLAGDERLRAILQEICARTGMRFSAIARVTEKQWIACLIEDNIEYGLNPGEEVKICETICDEIRESGEAVVIDDVSDDIKWSRHPVPGSTASKAIAPSLSILGTDRSSARSAPSIPSRVA